MMLSNAMNYYLACYRGLTTSAWRGIALNFLQTLCIGIFYFLTIYFVNVLHFNIKQAGFIISCYGVGTILGGMLGGKLADRFAPRRILCASLTLQGLMYLCIPSLHTVGYLALNLFFQGIASYSFVTANYAQVLQACAFDEKNRLKALNLLNVAANIGLALSAGLISVLPLTCFEQLFLVIGAALILLAVYGLQGLHDEKVSVAAHAEKVSAVKRPRRRLIYVILACIFLVGLIVAQRSSTYSLYLVDLFPERGVQGFGLLFTLNTVLVIALQNPLVSSLNRLNKVWVVGVSAFLIGMGMASLLFVTQFSTAIAACVIYTIGEMIFFSFAQLILYQNSQQQKRGQSLGLFRTMYAASRAVGPVLGGFVYYHAGGATLWGCCGIIGVLALLACTNVSRYQTT